jgi:hypothetical protein
VRDYIPTDDELLARVAYRTAEAHLEGLRLHPVIFMDAGSGFPTANHRGHAAQRAKDSFKAALAEPPDPEIAHYHGALTVAGLWWQVLDSMGWGWGKDREQNMELADQLEERWTAGVVSALERWRLGLPERVTTEPR